MTAKPRLVAEILEAVTLARQGQAAEAAARLDRIAADPEAATLGPRTALGLPRKLHSAWLRLAKAKGDKAAIAGLQATAVPPAALLADLFAVDDAGRGGHVAAASAPVPRSLHQVWIGGPPPAACEAWADYAARHGWSYRLWDEAALAEAGIAEDGLWRAMRALDDLPGAVDMARYHILSRHGGLYLDCDWYPARADLPPAAFLPGQGLSALAEPVPRLVAGGSFLLSNALVATPAGHPALTHLLSVLPEAAGRMAGAPAWWSTGPLTFTLAARRGPVTVLDGGLVAGHLPQGASLAEARALADSLAGSGIPGFVIAWKGW